jgi:hypothetical protein
VLRVIYITGASGPDRQIDCRERFRRALRGFIERGRVSRRHAKRFANLNRILIGAQIDKFAGIISRWCSIIQ